jgi:hypothetical protein
MLRWSGLGWGGVFKNVELWREQEGTAKYAELRGQRSEVAGQRSERMSCIQVLVRLRPGNALKCKNISL